MLWRGRDESSNVETRGGLGRAGLVVGGGGGVVLLVLSLVFGVDLTQLVDPSASTPRTAQRTPTREEKDLTSFTKVVLRDTEVVWAEQFRRIGRQYREPKLVIFDGAVQSACGNANRAVGPFYCPGDERIYIDLGFYRDMERKLGAEGDFARAYVIAHEVGHHVQKQLGYLQKVDTARRSGSKRAANRASVRLELQADFLAGVWANQGQRKFQFLEAGDVEEAMNAAYQVGDDRLQKRAQGYVVPDSFTHGTSKEREAAFRQGLASGDVRLAAEYFAVGEEAGR